jgi:hypothetical protein
MDKNNYGLIEISFQFRVFKEKNFFDKMFFRTPTKVMLCTMPVLKLLQINKNGTCTIGTPEIYTNPYHDANPAYGSHAEQLLGKDLFSNSITIPVRDILSVGFIERGIRGN